MAPKRWEANACRVQTIVSSNWACFEGLNKLGGNSRDVWKDAEGCWRKLKGYFFGYQHLRDESWICVSLFCFCLDTSCQPRCVSGSTCAVLDLVMNFLQRIVSKLVVTVVQVGSDPGGFMVPLKLQLNDTKFMWTMLGHVWSNEVCNSSYFLALSGACVEHCPDGEYEVGDEDLGRECKKCPSGFNRCISAKMASECNNHL